jgi:small subunit ribosomal protein S4
MVPYLKKMDRARFNYKNLFFTKQQLKNFYGDLKEYEMRNIFKRSWNVSKNFRCNTFLGALEQRSSMVLFRMRFLPTIFACHQYIKHKGILVNEKIINHPNYCIGIGDIMTIPNDQ